MNFSKENKYDFEQIEKYINKHLLNNEDKIKKIIRRCVPDMKQQNKRLKDDISKIASKYDHIK